MPDPGEKVLTAGFYARDTSEVARALLGKVLETSVDGESTGGLITEVEAYVGPHDPAAHGYGGRRSKRNEAMFGPAGTAYVYFIYGMHWCFNAVTGRRGYPSAVLVRSLEPMAGLEVMKKRRGTENERLLCAGPARLCEALGIDGTLNGCSLTDGPVKILKGPGQQVTDIAAGPRIGISRAADWPLRFCDRGSDWLSKPAP